MDGLVRSLAIGVGWNVDDNGLQQANRQTDGLISSADRAEKEVDQLGRSGEQAGNRLTRGFRSAKNSLQSGIGILREYKYELTAMAAAGVTGMFRLASRAGDAQETVNKFRVVFGDFADESRSWAKNYSDQIGRSEYATMDWLNSFQDVLVPMGLARNEAAGLSQEMVTLAADLGSFNNVATDEAAQAMQSALVGNHEAVRGLGIQLNENRLNALALAEGYEENFAQLDALTKMELRYQEMIRQSDDAVGDATRTALEFNNQQLAFKGNLRDTAIALGNQYIPSMNEGLIATNDFLDAFQVSEWVGPTARIGALATGLGLVGAAAAWLGGSGMLAIAGFGLTVGSLALILEDLWSLMKGNDSVIGGFIDDTKYFRDESEETIDDIIGTFEGFNDVLVGVFTADQAKVNEGLAQMDNNLQDMYDNLVEWREKFATYIEDKFNIFDMLEEFSTEIDVKERPDWLPEEIDWWGDEDTEMPDASGFFDDLFGPPKNEESSNVAPKSNWLFDGLFGPGSTNLDEESKKIQNNNSTEIKNNTNNNDITINVKDADDPKAVGKEVKKQLNSYLKLQAGEVGAN